MTKQLANVLVDSGLVTDLEVQQYLEDARARHSTLWDVLLDRKGPSAEVLADMFAKATGFARLRLGNTLVDPAAIARVNDRLVRKHQCVPVRLEGRTLVLAMANPLDYNAIRDIEFATGLAVRPGIASRPEITAAIEEFYTTRDRIANFMADVPNPGHIEILSADDQDLDLAEQAAHATIDVAPLVKLCNLIIADAIKAGASDVHLEPALNEVQVRMRVDGLLRDHSRIPKWVHNPLVSRLKIMAKLDIAERRRPQDGRIKIQYDNQSLDLRISTLPTHFGEKVVLRVLGFATLPSFEKMGLSTRQSAILDDALAKPQGIILVTGPTGSGKTTSLYAMLSRRRSSAVNVVTIEDPIEFQLPGINQVQVNPKAGLTFATSLRSILRQDPDVILVGELRDRETAEVAFQAAMTGHLVLSTLHTNSAIATITRLLDLGLDRNQLASSFSLIIAQRLVRRVCPACSEPCEPDPAQMEKLRLRTSPDTLRRGRGCPACGQTGYAGRVGLYEFLRPTVTLRDLIQKGASETDLRSAALQAGTRFLRDEAIETIAAGITTPEEVLRVVQFEQEAIPCPRCQKPIDPDFGTCPYCLECLRALCGSCADDTKLSQRAACPYTPAPTHAFELPAVAAAAAGSAKESLPAPVSFVEPYEPLTLPAPTWPPRAAPPIAAPTAADPERIREVDGWVVELGPARFHAPETATTPFQSAFGKQGT